MPAYYNEIDPFAAQWLRNLIVCGEIAPGDVDERSIVDVRHDDLAGYDQCHFFAGIGGWSLALRLAGWPDDRPVWTGSCPCQPFSAAGKRGGTDDERHLWPEFFRLIGERRPTVVFGEQVASKAGLGWLDLVSADLERASYAVGAADLCAAGIGAPHIRQRLWWVADRESERRNRREGTARPDRRDCPQNSGDPRRLADANGGNAGAEREQRGREHRQQSADGGVYGDGRPGPHHGFWQDADWLRCRDGRWRPVEPGTFPLAHGIPGRVGKLRAYGNAIVPQVAAEFIAAYRDVTEVSDG